MSIHDELIAKTLMAKPTTEEGYLNIDWDTRLITVPETLTNIGVYNDKDTNRLYFRCPIEYGEFKIADFGLRVNYQNTGISTTKYDGDVYFVDDVESDGDYLTFSWLVGRHAYLEQGTTAFIVCCKVIDGDNNVVNELNTTIAILDVLEGLEVDVLPPEEYPDYLEALLRRIEAVEDKAIQGINVNGAPATVTDHIADIDVGEVYFGTCTTSESTATKTVSCSNLTQLTDGVMLFVEFGSASIADAPKLNVNGTGEADILVDGRIANATYPFRWAEDASILFLYANKCWRVISSKTTYATICVSDAGTAEKDASADNIPFVLQSGTQIMVNFENENTAENPTLNVSYTGAYPIIGDTDWAADERVTFAFDGEHYVIQSGSTEEVRKTANEALEKATAAEDTATEIADTAITGVDVNGNPAEVIDHRVNIEAATTDDLNAVEATAEAAETTATEALNKATAVEDSALTGINVNGTAAEVVDHVAQISTSGGGGEIGFVDGGTSITVHGASVFGLLVFCDEKGVAMFAYDFSNYATTENIRSTFDYDGDEVSFLFIETGFYIIFGADSIVID